MVIAALFVQKAGVYDQPLYLPDVDVWDEARDARRYLGPHAVVAHPPCSRWCRLAGLVEKRWGHKRGDDGGCFEAALEAVRRFGGVLEHPAYSDAWKAFGLTRPDRRGGWQLCAGGGFVCHVEQGRYGHPAKKSTWLFASGIDAGDLPELRWGAEHDHTPSATVSWCGNARIGDLPTNGLDAEAWRARRRLRPKEASATPPAFQDALLEIARAAERRRLNRPGASGSLGE